MEVMTSSFLQLTYYEFLFSITIMKLLRYTLRWLPLMYLSIIIITGKKAASNCSTAEYSDILYNLSNLLLLSSLSRWYLVDNVGWWWSGRCRRVSSAPNRSITAFPVSATWGHMHTILLPFTLCHHGRASGIHAAHHFLAFPKPWQFISRDKVALNFVLGDDTHPNTTTRRTISRHRKRKS